MNLRVFIISCIIILFSIYNIVLADSYWDTEKVDIDENLSWFSFFVGINDQLHISYLDADADMWKYAFFDGVNWNVEDIDKAMSNPFHNDHNSLSIDSDNHPHISYVDKESWNLKYAFSDGNKWHYDIIENTWAGSSYIVVDRFNDPHIIFIDELYNNLSYACYDGTNWNIETVDTELGAGGMISVELDSKNYPHIAYTKGNNLNYAFFNGTSWKIDTVDDLGWANTATKISLVIDKNERIHICYPCRTFIGDETIVDLRYAFFDGFDWVVEVIHENISSLHNSLAIDSKNYPHISYLSNNSLYLNYAFFDGEKWNYEKVDKNTWMGYSFSFLKIDKNDTPTIYYYDSFLDNLYCAVSIYEMDNIDNKNNINNTNLIVISILISFATMIIFLVTIKNKRNNTTDKSLNKDLKFSNDIKKKDKNRRERKKILNNKINELLELDLRFQIVNVKKLIDNNQLDEAEKKLEETLIRFENYNKLRDELENINDNIGYLTKRFAENKLDSKSYNRALDELERKKKENEERMWKLRNELFKEDYEKPF